MVLSFSEKKTQWLFWDEMQMSVTVVLPTSGFVSGLLFAKRYHWLLNMAWNYLPLSWRMSYRAALHDDVIKET